MTPEQLANLSPAPWEAEGREVTCPAIIDEDGFSSTTFVCTCEGQVETANAVFIALARNAFDIMIRRHWHPMRWPDGKWCVGEPNGSQHSHGSEGWDDPYTALVEADRWMKEQEAKRA